jgi:hypothetical protein
MLMYDCSKCSLDTRHSPRNLAGNHGASISKNAAAPIGHLRPTTTDNSSVAQVVNALWASFWINVETSPPKTSKPEQQTATT